MLVSGLCVLALETDFQRMKTVAAERFGEKGLAGVVAWQAFLVKTSGDSDSDKLLHVNDYINHQTRYVEDMKFWGEQDYWATPLETIGSGGGDCEDFALAKYLSLRLLGIPADRMRLTYVRAMLAPGAGGKSRAHMVVSYYPKPQSEPLILDSLSTEILPASKRSDLKPVFSFNSEVLWVAGRPDLTTDPTARLSHWRDVVARMADEGSVW